VQAAEKLTTFLEMEAVTLKKARMSRYLAVRCIA
jgi:hypothetical protein